MLLAGPSGAETLLGEILAIAPTAMAVLDGPEHRYTLINDAYRRIAGGKGEVVGRTLREVWPEAAAAVVPVLDEVFASGRPYSAAETPFIVERGGAPETIWLTFSFLPLRAADGAVRGILVMTNEVSELVRARLAAEDAVFRLQTEQTAGREREEQLRASVARERVAREGAEQSARFSELFTGMLGHDLRNPLSAIATGAELLLRVSSSDRQSRTAARIVSSAQRMSRMIDQLLDLTRIRLGAGLGVRRSSADLAQLVRQAVEEIEHASPESAISLDLTGDLTGAWDGERLLQVLSNLLGNAVHHGADGRIVLRGDGTQPDAVTLDIGNTGAIPADLLPRVFEPFRGDAQKSAGTRGLGLGLYITREIVTAHGGDVSVESTTELGTTVRVRLPRGTPEPPAGDVP